MTLVRIATAAVLIPIVIVLVLLGSTGLVTALVGVVALLCLHEFFGLGARVGLAGYRVWTAACALALLWQQWSASRVQEYSLPGDVQLARGVSGSHVPIELVLIVFVLGAAIHVVAVGRPLAGALGDISISAAALLFIALPLTALVRLHAVPVLGPRLLLFSLALVWAGDTLAYFAGRSLGRRRLAPDLSPGKTWEGAIANVMGSLMVGVGFARWLHVDLRHMLIVAALAGIAGQVGDLLESAYKRSAGAKDSGTLLPGHGGMLDRIDALLLAAPVVWYYFDLVLPK